ncbi:acetate--CoA ligase family protein [Methylovirgula sp. 4M-Z18]|uniref:acetate--CoA ligase family protein n=1 Tax=Methylovirgula sp. 4M-Z18 TaxID=2293567 RepID=UPI000E2E9FC2|nr:acetate--CoA ligase family protein [Methylovirgula sp. 4M-Z18]RFB79145.1 CoA-binding protein [Methylovirgula sp. 4M-Z18]
MTRSNFSRLLAPHSIAVIGGREAEEVVRQCRRIGFSGPIWPVNPKREEMDGIACFTSIADIPGTPDATFIAVPREASVAAIADLAQRGTGGAVCYASGFAEYDETGAALQDKLVAQSGAMALAGPNCYGLLNYLDGAALWPDQHGGTRLDRGVAIITQSGNIGLNLTMQQRGLPLAYLIAVGNKAKGDISDWIEALLQDERVTAIGLHLEGLGDVAAFARATAAARAKRIPIVVVKTGRSQAGAALTMSHTSSLAGPDKLYDALFARLGIARAPDLSSLLETLKLLHVVGPLAGRRLSSMSCSGGEASLIADLAETYGLTTPPLPQQAKDELAAVLGPKVSVANPLDYHTYIWGDLDASTACFTAMLQAGYDINLLVIDLPREDRCKSSDWDVTLQAFAAARAKTGACAGLVASLTESLPEHVADKALACGIVPLSGFHEALTAIRLSAGVGEAWARAEQIDVRPAPQQDSAHAAALTEAAAKDALAAFGLVTPERRIVAPHEAAEAAAALGLPVVLKASSETITHKTEAGAVRLNLHSAAEVAAAAKEMAHLAPHLLVERMVSGAVAELIVGVTRDAQFGQALTIGAGGVLVELMQDSATLLLPTSRAEILRALQGLKIAALLRGYRGKPAADFDALVGAIESIAAYAQAHLADLVELDVNPLLALPDGAVAVDALIRLHGGHDG